MTDFFWEKAKWASTDKHLVQLSNMPFKRSFPFMPKGEGLYIIRGPRQVGKTSWLKSMLVGNEASAFYYSCEQIEGHRELRELLSSVSDRSLVLLDEVNYVKEWHRAVKSALDAGELKTLVVTGSHSYDLVRGADRMPGRYGEGGEFVLLPLSLEEFMSARQEAGWKSECLLQEVEAFFRVGGFPSAIKEGGPEGKYPKKSAQMIWRWISGDVVRLGKSEESLTELMGVLASVMGTPISLNSITSKTSIGSHNTIKDYLILLQSLFAVRDLKFIDVDTGNFHLKKNRKYYFTDPLIYAVAASLAGKKHSVEALAEMVAHEALARKHSRFGYYSTKKQGEVDFILPKKWAVEIKWSELATNLSKAYLNLNLPKKEVWTKNNYASLQS